MHTGCINYACPQWDENCEHTGYCDRYLECTGKCHTCTETSCCNHPTSDRTCEQCGSDCCPE